MPAQLEHANVTVSDPAATAAWMEAVFGWHLRWEGGSIHGGHSKHIGSDDRYIALYSPVSAGKGSDDSYHTVGGLNHLAVTVDDLDVTERAVQAQGFETHSHADYEPGRRFYFNDSDGIEYEVVQY